MLQNISQPNTVLPPRLNKYGYNCIARHISLAVVVSAPLFIAAGTWRWDWAWIYAALTLIGWVASSLILAVVNPEILNERGKRATHLVGTKSWDWRIMAIYAVLLVVLPVVAGLDYRNGWSPPTRDMVKLIGAMLLLVSFVPLTWAMAVNRFFEATVRIQTSRGHQVIATGPYRYVRHPGYVGVILQFIVVPLILGTNVAWIPALLGVALYLLRTWLEDRTLIAELPGYADYAQRTRYRLLPGVW